MPAWTQTFSTIPRRQVAANEIQHIDVNADGYDDLIVAGLVFPLENRGMPITVYLNNGVGGFTDATATFFPSGAPTVVHPREIVTADFNGDGRPDIFIADHGYDASPFPGAQN